MYYCCKGCDDCCRDCCKCLEDCCGECCDCVSQVFSAPFSFCTFLSFFITVGPGILMVIAIFQSKGFHCQQPIKTHVILEGICNTINFLFCLYLTCQYSKSYAPDSKFNKLAEINPELNILQRTVNLILYDYVVCFYIFGIVFFVIWTSLGNSWIEAEPLDSPCRTFNDGFLITVDQINIYSMWAFLFLGTVIFIYLLILYSCDDGSCTCGNYNRCCCLILTCGLCDIGRSEGSKFSKQAAKLYRQTYQTSRQQWIASAKRLCSCLSLERKPTSIWPQNNNDASSSNRVQFNQVQPVSNGSKLNLMNHFNQVPSNPIATSNYPPQDQFQPQHYQNHQTSQGQQPYQQPMGAPVMQQNHAPPQPPQQTQQETGILAGIKNFFKPELSQNDSERQNLNNNTLGSQQAQLPPLQQRHHVLPPINQPSQNQTFGQK